MGVKGCAQALRLAHIATHNKAFFFIEFGLLGWLFYCANYKKMPIVRNYLPELVLF
jgi:hypothetical protein